MEASGKSWIHSWTCVPEPILAVPDVNALQVTDNCPQATPEFPRSPRHKKQIALFRLEMTVTFHVERGERFGRLPGRGSEASRGKTQLLAGSAGCPPTYGKCSPDFCGPPA